jgi:hypothetical protein
MKSNRSGNYRPLHPSQGFGGFFPRGARWASLPRADGSKTARGNPLRKRTELRRSRAGRGCRT